MFEEEIKQKAKERKLKTTLAWRKRNWDRCLEVARQYRKRNREKIRQQEGTDHRKKYKRNWIEKNKEKTGHTTGNTTIKREKKSRKM